VQRQMGNLMNQVVAAAGEPSGLVDATFDVDAGRLVIHWHDHVPPRVQAVLDRARDAPFEVVVEPARFSRGALQAEVRRLRAEHPATIAAMAVRTEGDGLYVTIVPEIAQAAGSPRAAAAQHGLISDHPLWFERPASSGVRGLG
jgi:hypothetical protein